MSNIKQELVETKFAIGAVVKHRFLDFRGVIFDVDPEFNNTEEWYQSIPTSIRPRKNQPFYHLFAENGHIFYVAYVSLRQPLDKRIKGLLATARAGIEVRVAALSRQDKRQAERVKAR